MTERTPHTTCVAPYNFNDCISCARETICVEELGALTSGLIESLLDAPDHMLLKHVAEAKSQLVKSMCENLLTARKDTQALLVRIQTA